MVSFNWSWDDYERCKRREERKAAECAASAEAVPSVTLRAEFERREECALRGAKIDISAAPSGMESAAARWAGKGPAPMELAPVPVLCAGEIMCRCGSRASGKGRGPVPVWFGDKCIEANCELRGAQHG